MSAKDNTEIEGRGRFARKRAAKDAPRQRSLRPLRMVWQAGKNYPGHVALALLALCITAAATLAIPAGFKLVIDRGFAAGADPADMGRWFRYLLLIVAVLAAGTAMRFYFVSWLGERVVADIRLRVQENLLRLAPGFYEENSPKEISSRMTSDTALIEQVVGTTVSVALRNLLMTIGGTAYLFWLVPSLTLGLFLIIPAIVIPITLFGRRLRKVSRTSQDRVADIGAMVTEVLSAMKIVQAGDVSAKNLTGSWAGAMGHTQFIPTSYLAWAVDVDGDGHRNVWTSPPDALASAANLLKKNGWETGKTWGYEVALPAGFDTRLEGRDGITLAKWMKLGVKRARGGGFPRPGDEAVLKLPAGNKGPAFLMVRNFYVLKRYNNADKYALTVGLLADELAGHGGLVNDWPRGYEPLDEAGRKEMQRHLQQLGHYDGEIDGKFGPASKKAVLEYQQRHGMNQDGFPSKALLDRLNRG